MLMELCQSQGRASKPSMPTVLGRQPLIVGLNLAEDMDVGTLELSSICRGLQRPVSCPVFYPRSENVEFVLRAITLYGISVEKAART
jgi:hypothetical protein